MRSSLNSHHLLLWSFVILLIIITLSDSRLGLFSIATPLKVALIFALFLGNLKVYVSGNVEIPFYKYFIPFYALAILLLISSGFELVNLVKTLAYFFNLFLIPYLVVTIYSRYGKKFLRLYICTILGVLLCGLALLTAGFEEVYFGSRYRGILGNPNSLGMFTFFSAVSFYLITFYHKDLFRKKYLVIGWSIILLSLLMSNSRNSMIALGIFFIFRTSFFKFKKIFQILTVVFILSTSSFLLPLVYKMIVELELEEELRIESFEDIKNGSGRQVAHDFAKDYIQDNFWIGKGIGTTEKIYYEAQAELNDKGHQGIAHNSFFTTWINTGFFGVVLFSTAWLVIFYRVEILTGFGFPIMLAVIFCAYFEDYLSSTLNPHTPLLLISLTLLLIPEFRSADGNEESSSKEIY